MFVGIYRGKGTDTRKGIRFCVSDALVDGTVVRKNSFNDSFDDCCLRVVISVVICPLIDNCFDDLYG